MATAKTEGFEKFIKKEITPNTGESPSITFPNKVIKKLRKHAFVRVILLYIVLSFSDHPAPV